MLKRLFTGCDWSSDVCSSDLPLNIVSAQSEPADENSGPGFEPVPLAEFCGMNSFAFYENSLCRPRIIVYESDCEIGLIDVKLTAEDYEFYLNLALRGVVTGKANAFAVTGGTTVIVYETSDGDRIGSMELYQGLLCGNDGMYSVEIP